MKYRNRKTVIDGIEFDSVKEAKRYQELLLLQRNKQISDLERQKKYQLIPSQKYNGKVVERPIIYIADFVYCMGDNVVVEDVKGFKTRDYVLKRKLMLYFFNIIIREI